MLKKHAVRFIHNGKSRTYIVMDVGTVAAICTALDLLEIDVPEIESCIGLAVISKTWPEGAHLACEGEGPVIDTTRPVLVPVFVAAEERVAA